jgi:hypothetical protein
MEKSNQIKQMMPVLYTLLDFSWQWHFTSNKMGTVALTRYLNYLVDSDWQNAMVHACHAAVVESLK